MKISQIAKITGAKCSNIEDKNVKRFIIDSRQAKEGDFFIPLKGNNVDGHQFIEDALNSGAYGSFSSKNINKKNVLIVNDPLKALTEIAKYKRNHLKTKIGITGTAGKTTTKEILSFLLSSFYPVYYTKGNLNNHIGMPLTLANVDRDYEYSVIEMGASQKGDISYLSDILKQDIAVITNVGYGHTEGFGSFKAVVEEKGNILKQAQFAVINENLKKFYNHKNIKTFGFNNADITVKEVYFSENGTNVVLKYKDRFYQIFIPVFNEKIAENVAIGFLIFDELGLPVNKIPEIISQFKPLKGRGNIIRYKNLTIIDDTYNANPVSVENAVKTLSKLSGNKILVLADMKELGKFSKELHQEVAYKILKSSINKIFLYGDEVKVILDIIKNKKEVYLFEDKKQIAEILKKEEGYSLIKGSRSMKMEEVINLIIQ